MLPTTQTRPVAAPSTRRVRRTGSPLLSLFSATVPCSDKPAAPDAFSPAPNHRSEKPGADLTGIARLAASSPLASEKRGTEYFILPVRSILNRCNSERVPFRWTVNPYRGCEFGCKYCYARYTHEYMELDGDAFERMIYAKGDAGERMEADLAKKNAAGEHIAIGTATDPYQPAENEFGVTRAILERVVERDGLRLSITTKSDRILRDLDLLRAIAARSALQVNITVVTLRTRLARLLEPRAPRPDLRLKAVQRLREAGIATGVHVMPVLPGINDSEEELDALARAAKSAGAAWLAMGTLFLMPSARAQFLPVIEEKFPRLARRYRVWYSRNAYAPDSYRKEISERARKLRARYGLSDRPPVESGPGPEEAQFCMQFK